MSIAVDALHELLDLSQVAALFPSSRQGRPVNRSSVRRWIVAGATAADGRRVRLAAVKLPAGLRVAPSALEAFVAALGASG